MSTATEARPVAAPGTRCLLLQLEPTPYILPRALYVYGDPDLHTDLIWTYTNQSQDWGKDADIGSQPVLLDRRVSRAKQLERVAKLMLDILRGRYTVAHLAGWGHWVVRLAILACKLRGVPFSVESDTQLNSARTGWRESLKRKIYPVLLNWPAVVIPGGSRQAELFRYYGVQDRKIRISHMTTDILKLRSLPSRPRHEFRDSKQFRPRDVLVTYVGRLEWYKGVKVLIEGFEKAAKQNPDLVLVVIGDGSMMKEIEGLRDRIGSVRVHIAGRQTRESVVEWMRCSDMLVLPSVHEQWGMVVNEAMACGLPVIVSDACGCVDDLVVEGKTGLIFPSGKSDALGDAIVRLASDEAARLRMGSEASALIAPWVIERQAETIRAALVRMSYQK